MNKRNAVRLAVAALSGMIGTPCFAAPAQALPAAGPAADAPAAVLAQRKQYGDALTAEAVKSQERLAALSQQLQALDADIESRVDRIVSLLATVKDSTDSKGRVRRSKDKAIAGLRNGISYYVRERDRRNKELAAGGSPASKEGLSSDVQALGGRIEKRVEQILTLANSMTQNEEFGRYERYRNTEFDYNTETKEFRRFEKDVSGTSKTKAEVIQELKASVDKQNREIKELHDLLLMTSDPQRKERLQEQIAEKEEIVADRREQVTALLSAPAPDTKPVSSDGAFEIDKLLAEMTLDLQRDFRKFQQLVSERNEAQVRARLSQERLDRFLKSQPAAASR